MKTAAQQLADEVRHLTAQIPREKPMSETAAQHFKHGTKELWRRVRELEQQVATIAKITGIKL